MIYLFIILTIILAIASIILYRNAKSNYELYKAQVNANNVHIKDKNALRKELSELRNSFVGNEKSFNPIGTIVTPEAQDTIFVADSIGNNVALKTGTVNIKLEKGKIVACYKTKRVNNRPKKVPVFIKVFR